MQALMFSGSEEVPLTSDETPRVRDIQDIRFQNFRFLLQEVEEELGRPRGVAAALAARTGVKASLISMLANHALHSETGKRRQIGDDTAKRLESGMGKPENWLDVDRQQARDHKEAEALDRWRALNATQREAVLKMMEAMSGADGAPGPSSGPAGPSPHAQP